jgi:hypothetical protein
VQRARSTRPRLLFPTVHQSSRGSTTSIPSERRKGWSCLLGSASATWPTRYQGDQFWKLAAGRVVAAMRTREHHPDLTFAPAQSGGSSEAIGARWLPRQDGPRDGQRSASAGHVYARCGSAPRIAGSGPWRATRGVHFGLIKYYPSYTLRPWEPART